MLVVLLQPGRWKHFGRWCLLMALAAVLWLPWAPAFIDQITTPGNLSRMGSSWKTQFAATPVVFAVGRTFAWRDAGPVLLALAAIASVVGYWVPALIGVIRPGINARICRPLLSAWILLPIVAPLAAAIVGVPVYHHRYGSVGLAGFLTAVAIGLTQIPRVYQVVAAIVIIAGTTFSLANYYQYPIKDDWRSAARAILDDAPPGQIVLTDSDIEVAPFLYYARKNGNVPHTVYGLMVEKHKDELLAVRVDDDRKRDNSPKNYTAEISGSAFM